MITLEERCLNLPYNDRMRLCEALRNSILKERDERKQPAAHRGGVLLGYMEEIIGEPVQTRCRKPIYKWARAMVAYQLIKEGYTTIDAGEMMGKCHATIIYWRNRMCDVLDYPGIYKDVIVIWKQFQNKIQDEIHRGTNQNTISLGGEFPDCGQQEMVKESGEVGTPCHMGDLHQDHRGQAQVY